MLIPVFAGRMGHPDGLVVLQLMRGVYWNKYGMDYFFNQLNAAFSQLNFNYALGLLNYIKTTVLLNLLYYAT